MSRHTAVMTPRALEAVIAAQAATGQDRYRIELDASDLPMFLQTLWAAWAFGTREVGEWAGELAATIATDLDVQLKP